MTLTSALLTQKWPMKTNKCTLVMMRTKTCKIMTLKEGGQKMSAIINMTNSNNKGPKRFLSSAWEECSSLFRGLTS